jgi:hypothetical protein
MNGADANGGTLHGEILLPGAQQHEEAVQSAERLAKLLDYQFRVAGVPIGLDAILGLIPGVGDVITGAVGLYFLKVGHSVGLPWTKRAAMVGNIAVDTAIGAIPLVGDLFDVGFKSHRRNARILRRHLETLSRPPRQR